MNHLEGLVNAALEREQYLAGCVKRDQSAIKELNEIYAQIHRFRSGGRKTPAKVARLMGAGYVQYVRNTDSGAVLS